MRTVKRRQRPLQIRCDEWDTKVDWKYTLVYGQKSNIIEPKDWDDITGLSFR